MQQRPQETLRQLCEIFPDFEEWWKIVESPPPGDGLVDGVFLSMDPSPRDARISNIFREESFILYWKAPPAIWRLDQQSSLGR
jgi:hypothetical protein